MIGQFIECLLPVITGKLSESELAARTHFEQLHAQINEFQNDLDDQHDLFASLVGFTNFRVTAVDFEAPYTIVFRGTVGSEESIEVEVIQHVNHAGLILAKVPLHSDNPLITSDTD